MNITPISVMTRVSDRLSDQEIDYEFELYTKRQTLSAFNWALATISQVAPQIFSEPKRVTLQAGSVQKIDGCERVVSGTDIYVNGEYASTPDDMGRLNPHLRRGRKCLSDDPEKYRVQYMSLTGDNTLNVYPPIPDDADVELDILCAYTPQADSDDSFVDVPTNVIPVLEELMLYYLYDIDSESVPNRGRSATHWEVAMTLLGVGKNVPRRSSEV